MIVTFPPEMILHIISFDHRILFPLRLTCKRMSFLLNGPTIARILHMYHQRCLTFHLRATKPSYVTIEDLAYVPFFSAMVRSFLSCDCKVTSFFAIVNQNTIEYTKHRGMKPEHYNVCSICICIQEDECTMHSLSAYGRGGTISDCGIFSVRSICDACYATLIHHFFVNTRGLPTSISRRWSSFILNSAETAYDHDLQQFCRSPSFF